MSSVPSGSDDQKDDDRDPATHNAPPGLPTWVKVFAVIAVSILVVFIAFLMSGDGKHGPGRHLPHGAGSMLSK